MARKKVTNAKKPVIDRRDYLLIIIPFLAVLASIVFTFHSQTQVLGTSTSTASSFSWRNLFAPIMSLFAGNKSSNNTPVSSSQTTLSQEQLLALADDTYAEGNLPLGDNKYTTTGAKKGYVYLCNVQKGNSGAQSAGSWIHGASWNIKEKIAIQGAVVWNNARFSHTISTSTRTLSGNDLPTHTTGVFPVATSDPAYQYDRNPNTIAVQSFIDSLPLHPTYLSTPYCMGGEVGIMLTGVALFNGFDAGLRDAVAHEVQDSCQGHPQEKGEYHYHGLSNCIKDRSVSTVIGFDLDGFPITGPKVAEHKYLITDDLDECHGITSEIMLDGKKTTSYHYVMTEDFPYSVSCFRGKVSNYQVVSSGNSMQRANQTDQQPGHMRGPGKTGQPSQQSGMRTPPQEAIIACRGKSMGVVCEFTTPMGSVSGTCQTPPNQTSTLCVPSNPPQH